MIKLKLSWVCCFFTILYNCHVLAQDITLLKQPIKKVPEVANLLKFIDHPVSISTGMPEINIPIYSISTNSVNFPIALRYYSGGIKVTETASRVGMGWVLYSNGFITQNVKGLNDIIGNPAMGYPGRLSSQFSNFDNPDICELKHIVEGAIDTEPDIFSFSFGNNSGSFFIDNNNKIGITSNSKLTIEALSGFSSWKITDADGVQYFFDLLGTTDAKTITTAGSAVVNWEVNQNVPARTQRTYFLTKIVGTSGEEVQFQYDPYLIGNVNFLSNTRTYDGQKLSYTKNYQISHEQTRHLKSILFANGKIEFVAGANRCDLYGDRMLDKIIVYDKQNIKIKEVRFNYKYFVGSQVLDVSELSCSINNIPSFDNIPDDDYKNRRLFLTNIEEIDISNNNASLRYSFEYNKSLGLPDRFSAQQDWWGYFNRNGLTTMLDDIFQDPGTGYFGTVYTTTHRNPDLVGTTEGVLRRITYPTGGYSEFEYELNTTYQGLHNPGNVVHPPVTYNVPHSTPAGNWIGTFKINNAVNISEEIEFQVQTCINGALMLDLPFSIKDQSGNIIYTEAQVAAALSHSGNGYKSGTLSFMNGTYVIHKAVAYSNPPCDYYIKTLTWYESPPIPRINPAGGIRVKKNTLYDPVTNKYIIKKYDYNRTENGALVSSGSAGGWDFITGYAFKGSNGLLALGNDPDLPSGEVTAIKFVLLSSPIYPLGSVYYNRITEQRIDQNGNNLGKTEYTYQNFGDNMQAPYSAKDYYNGIVTESENRPPLFTIEDNSWRRTLLLKKEDFAYGPTGLEPISSVENQYGFIFPDNVTGLASTYHFRSIYTLGKTCSPNSIFLPQFDKIAYSKYTLHSGYYQLVKQIKKEFVDENNLLTETIDYEYSTASRLPNKITSINSKGQKLINKMKYVGDFSDITNTSYGILGLQQRKALGLIVESSKFKVNTSTNDEGLVSSYFVSYLANRSLPVSVHGIETSKPLYDFDAAHTQNGAVLIDTRYQPKNIFSNYDAVGNVLEQQKVNNVKEVYLWGYNSQYPVAKIEGSDYVTVNTVVNQAQIDLAVNNSNPQVLMDLLNTLRTDNRTKTASVTTFTYRPLVGMTSETDPTGRTTFYEYDEFGRLKLIKDHQGKVLKKICYNYAGQPVDCNLN